MANRFTQQYHRETSTSKSQSNEPSSPESPPENHSTTQRQLSDSRTTTSGFVIFERPNSLNFNEIIFLQYFGTRARNHHTYKLYLPQIKFNEHSSSTATNEEFADRVREVLRTIPPSDLSSYVVSVRTGLLYFFSKRFRFNQTYHIDEIIDLVRKRIPTSDHRYYYPPKDSSKPSDDSLRSTFANVKAVSQTRDFVDQLEHYEFRVQKQKYVFRIYLQSDDKQTHVCVVDPAWNYSIVEFSKDFQRTSNIDFIRDRSSSRFSRTKTYDDVFDFRVQFQYNPRTCHDQRNTIEYELRQQFPTLDPSFRNENILQPFHNLNADERFHISDQLCPYIQFIRRDFGDVYEHRGIDPLFENFTIYLESSVEYLIDKKEKTCQRELASHGLVYARLDLNTMITSNGINEQDLINKLWNMGEGLTYIAGRCTTSDTRQSTNYYTSNGEKYTAEDETLVQTILKRSVLQSMLSLPMNSPIKAIQESFDRITDQLENKWHFMPAGPAAREKLIASYTQYRSEQR